MFKSKKHEIIKIKYHDTSLTRLEKIDIGDWVDLRASEDVFVPLNEYKLLSLGVSMKLPHGYEAHIAPRSSTFKTWGIIQTNGLGIIDNSYSGTNDIWRFPAYCLVGNDTYKGKKGTWIHKNDRICQFRIVPKQPTIEFDEMLFLDEIDRNGIGSTGIN